MTGDRLPTDLGSRLIALRIHAVLSWLWLLVGLPWITDASSGDLGLILLAAWLLLSVFWGGLFLEWYPTSLLSRAGRRCLLASGLALLLGFVLGATRVGLTLRVALCEPVLTCHIANLPPGTRDYHEPRLVGLFWVHEEQEHQGAVALYTSYGFMNRYGVAYLPPGTSLPRPIRHLQHLYGPWYAFEWKF
jgi:hypothetical protein